MTVSELPPPVKLISSPFFRVCADHIRFVGGDESICRNIHSVTDASEDGTSTPTTKWTRNAMNQKSPKAENEMLQFHPNKIYIFIFAGLLLDRLHRAGFLHVSNLLLGRPFAVPLPTSPFQWRTLHRRLCELQSICSRYCPENFAHRLTREYIFPAACVHTIFTTIYQRIVRLHDTGFSDSFAGKRLRRDRKPTCHGSAEKNIPMNRFYS